MIRIGKELTRDVRVFDYAEYAILYFLRSAGQNCDLMDFCHPKLQDLIRYDEGHGTEYLYTAFVLLTTGGKQVDAAKKLGIHRSTMLYRLEKIEEITGGLNLYDTYVVTILNLSFSILVLTGQLDYSKYRF